MACQSTSEIQQDQDREPPPPHSTDSTTQHNSSSMRRNRKPSTQQTTNVISSSHRHKRTHDRGDGVEGGFSLSGEDEEEYSGEDHLGSLEEASPNSEGGYVTTSLNSVANSTPPTSNGSMGPNTSMQPSFNSLQTLSMPMTISQPHALGQAVMM